MEYGPPPLFNQGVSARARLAFFSVFAVILIVIDARVNALDVLRNGVAVMLAPLERTLLVPRDLVVATSGYFTSLASLRDENDRLRREALEHAQTLGEARQLLAENGQLRAYAGMSARVSTPSRVVRALYESRDPFSHKVIIDHGTRDGIRAGCPVLDETGIVGQVTRVFLFGAEVTLLTDKDQAIPVQIARNGLHAIAFGGSEAATLELRYLPANADVEKGDAVVASGLDGMYPAGTPVATVLRVERDVKDQFARVVLQPTGGTTRGRHLLVLLVEAPPGAAPSEDAKGSAGAARADSSVRRAARR
jgi:rod shape-determining protein MreC